MWTVVACLVLPLVLSFFIGQLIRDERVGNDYLTFVSIGLGVTSMLGGALSGFGMSLQRAFQRGTLETYLVEPVPWTFLPFAMNTWQVLLGLVNVALWFRRKYFAGDEQDPVVAR